MAKSLKIEKISAPDLICNNIKELITTGEWPCYQKIPSESELAEQFGVNRLTVRIALQRLNALGILDTRVGDGTYVCAFDFSQHMSSITEFYMSPKLLDDVAEFRNMIEVESARLAILHATSEDFENLRICATNYEIAGQNYLAIRQKEGSESIAAKKAFRKFNEMDIAFHSQICAMSHNNLIFYAYTVAKPVILEYIEKNAVTRTQDQKDPANRRWDINNGIQYHWDIYHAILQRDFDTCRKLCIDMIGRNSI